MSDGGQDRASLGMGAWKSSQTWCVQRSAVRSIAWLDDGLSISLRLRTALASGALTNRSMNDCQNGGDERRTNDRAWQEVFVKTERLEQTKNGEEQAESVNLVRNTVSIKKGVILTAVFLPAATPRTLCVG
jgi:hypothetical protein